MVRIAVFGICPEGRRHLIERSVDILAQLGRRVMIYSPFDMAKEMLTGDHVETGCISRILDDVSLEIDLKALATDIVVEMPYSFPSVCEMGSAERLLTSIVEDKAIGRGFGVFFEDEKIKKYDAVLYIDLDSGTLLDRDPTLGLSKKDIDDWKMFEKYRLRALCRRSNVLYSAFTVMDSLDADIAKRIDIIFDSR